MLRFANIFIIFKFEMLTNQNLFKMKNSSLFIICCLLTIAASAQGINLKQVGKANQYMNVQFAEKDNNGHLYTIDFSNGLNKTNLATGEMSKINDVNYKNTEFLFYYRFKLYSMDKDGSLTEIDPVSGQWTLRSGISAWSEINRPVVVGSFLYAAENGSFYRYGGLDPKSRTQIGGADFYSMGRLIKNDTSLYSMISDGSLYRINLRTGEWNRMGGRKSKDWKFAIAAELMNNKIYTIETNGALYETSLPGGERKLIDTNKLEKGRVLISVSGKLYAITTDGYLYEIEFTN